MQPGMRYFQALPADDHIAIEEQIQVDHPRAPPFPPYASHFFFHAQKEREQILGTHSVFERKNGIDEGRLRDRPYGLCTIKRRNGSESHPRAFLQRIFRLPNLANRLAQVGACADKSTSLLAQNPAFSILSSASLSLSSGTVRAKRIYPSPEGPNPLPGVVTTPQFLRICAVNSLDVKPSGHFTQT